MGPHVHYSFANQTELLYLLQSSVRLFCICMFSVYVCLSQSVCMYVYVCLPLLLSVSLYLPFFSVNVTIINIPCIESRLCTTSQTLPSIKSVLRQTK